jgi:hypothetical protein
MVRILLLLALAGVAVVGLFGCSGSSTTGFGDVEAFISGRYDVLSKDPGVLPNFSSVQLSQSGKSLEGIDNLGRTWTGTLSNFTKSGVFTAGGQQQQQPTQPGQQQQPTVPESFAAEIYLTTQTTRGTISLTGVVESRATLSIPTTGGQQPPTTATSAYVAIFGTAVDERGNAGSVTLYNPVQVQTQTTTTP